MKSKPTKAKPSASAAVELKRAEAEMERLAAIAHDAKRSAKQARKVHRDAKKAAKQARKAFEALVESARKKTSKKGAAKKSAPKAKVAPAPATEVGEAAPAA